MPRPSGLSPKDYRPHDESSSYFKRTVSNAKFGRQIKKNVLARQVKVVVDGRVFESIVKAAGFINGDVSYIHGLLKKAKPPGTPVKYKGCIISLFIEKNN